MDDRQPITLDLMRGTLDLLVLRTLAAGPSHGYAIAQRIKQISGSVLQVAEGSLYPALQRLLVEGWVTAEWTTSETNRRARIYKLTAAGRRQLAREAKEFRLMVVAIEQVLELA
jgi:PadR family transcriptional regulator, regulatory protein PadR